MNLIVLFIGVFLGVLYPEDIVLKAMRDELKRNLSELYEKEFPKPYFISYSVYDIELCKISASFGSIKSTSKSKQRVATLDLRIGDSSFDNSNFITNLYNFKPRFSIITTDDNYDAIRWGLWYLTDEVYKEACETLSRKKAYRQKREIKEVYPEISTAPPISLIIEDEKRIFDCDGYTPFMKELSVIAKRYPAIRSIDFQLNLGRNIMRYADTNNSYFKKPTRVINLSVEVEMQDNKNYLKTDKREFIYMTEDEFKRDVFSDVERYLEMISNSSEAYEIDYFGGPCVFERDAAAQFINYLFVRNISFYPLPETEQEKSLQYYYDIPKLIERMKKKVFPGFIDVYDDPTIVKENSISLAGFYQVDDEGVVPERLILVRNGVLENIYSSKRPSKYSSKSNGRGRGSIGMYVYPFSSNIFVESQKVYDDEEFLKKVYEYAKDQGYEEVLFVERLYSQLHDKDKGLPNPVVAYILNVKTGKKHYLTNVEFEGVTLRMLRDIGFTSKKRYVYNFLQKGPFSYSPSVFSSLVIPERFFIREVELIRSHSKPQKKPYIQHPYFSSMAK